MTAYARLFLQTGTLRSLDNINGFPYEGILTTCIVLLDEPNFCLKYVEDFKELFAGQSFQAKKKYLSPQTLYTQLFIMLSNKTNIFNMDDPIWKVRTERFFMYVDSNPQNS